MILGAASAGLLVSGFGAASALAIDAFTFFIAGLLVFTFRHMTPRAAVTENTVLDDLRHGWQVFRSFRWIVVIVISFSFNDMCWVTTKSVFGPLIALEYFDGPRL